MTETPRADTAVNANTNAQAQAAQALVEGLGCRTLILEYDASVLSITLNRPEKRNALNGSMVDEIISVFSAISKENGIRAVVLRGSGKHFCAGGDISGMHDGTQSPEVQRQAHWALNRRFGELSLIVHQAPQVVVALLQGAVLGGGFGMACAADIAIADHQAKFAMPETSLGVVPAQIAPFVIARIGLSQARRLALLGERINGEEAWRLGLVHFLSQGEEEMEAKLQSVLGQIKACAPNANMATKNLLQSMDSVINKNNMDAVLDHAADVFVEALFSDEGKEGTAAFIEKRKPTWAQL